VNVFYVLIRTTEKYEFNKIRTAGVTGNTTNYTNSQGDNPICSTRDEISQPSRPISPRAATAVGNIDIVQYMYLRILKAMVCFGYNNVFEDFFTVINTVCEANKQPYKTFVLHRRLIFEILVLFLHST